MTVPSRLQTEANRRVLEFALPRSAHGGVAGPLFDSIKRLPDVASYCADPASFRSVLVYTEGIVFAFAEGMEGVSVRLRRDAMRDALGGGAVDRGELGEGWVLLPLFANDCYFLQELPALIRDAYDAVRAPPDALPSGSPPY